MFSSWKEHKKGVCSCCGKATEDSVRINEGNGFCQSSYTVYVCKEHRKSFTINDQWFVKVGGTLFHEFNADYGICNYWRKINSEEHYEAVRNEKEDEFLSDVDFY